MKNIKFKVFFILLVIGLSYISYSLYSPEEFKLVEKASYSKGLTKERIFSFKEGTSEDLDFLRRRKGIKSLNDNIIGETITVFRFDLDFKKNDVTTGKRIHIDTIKENNTTINIYSQKIKTSEEFDRYSNLNDLDILYIKLNSDIKSTNNPNVFWIEANIVKIKPTIPVKSYADSYIKKLGFYMLIMFLGILIVTPILFKVLKIDIGSKQYNIV